MQLLFPLLGSEILTALAMLYLMLGMASLGVGVKLRARPHSQLRAQVNAWWWIFPVVTVSLLLHPLGATLLAALIGLLALRELAPFGARGFALPAAAVFGSALFLPSTVALVALPAAIAVAGAIFWRGRSRPALVWLLWLVLCYSCRFLPLYDSLPLEPHLRLAWLFYLYVLTALNDVAQFISGTIFGRHRIAPGISPNKTWQGLAGGVMVTSALSLTLGRHLHLADAAHLAGFALLLSLGGFCGDLMFSAAKRVLGVKDFSQLIPGHGGILDRVDSLVVTAPLLYFLITHLLGN
ncbi:phosphatidate cytidylyltransferase [Duganella violaceipulchra]|uniref:Phosphatidate cytidylyltransferase n=1 Tax=Duganella violaceipulchra TaxID=2849652 RepID=A0AA41L9K9_9BURK|nr:phosphatidate cytidylyltransferase [Duganella violaceicalia]MBV6323365.1 phosphatidate cytidylyltransferase [Duganella violaceicalia]MCP2007681.1 phosphatidate cytidylyltransferase [Duganella violaceicalia]